MGATEMGKRVLGFLVLFYNVGVVGGALVLGDLIAEAVGDGGLGGVAARLKRIA
jgi:hypothetical protein